MPVQLSAEDFIQRYVATAKKARALFPEIKLMGPVPANEWQWFIYDGKKINYQGTNYVWLEYFIKRIAEEQKASGVRLLDVLDIHFYPEETKAEDIVQLHRVYFDRNYNYPGANGVKKSGASEWDNTITKEYIFERCKDWLRQYFGEDHGISFGVTETGIKVVNPTVTAVWYASTLGEFARQNVEIFTPWSWENGMWETLHLFSRYSKENYVSGTSSNELLVSAYPSISNTNDSLTIMLVNRSVDKSQTVTVQLSNFFIGNGTYNALTLENLPADETFKSHTSNALVKRVETATNNSTTVTLPKMSVTALLLKGSTNSAGGKIHEQINASLYPNPTENMTSLSFLLKSDENMIVQLCNLNGKVIRDIRNEKLNAGKHVLDISTDNLKPGVYFIKMILGSEIIQKKLVVK
jgi:hypothetical protein